MTFTCIGCGVVQDGRSQRRYCSNTCQRAHERRLHIEAWLLSGHAHAGTRRSHYVRNYLLEEQGGRCAICARDGEWEGQPLAFVLDHVDGDSGNNARENLRLVCPNCDSQLPTYKSRNRGRGRFSRRQRYQDGQSY